MSIELKQVNYFYSADTAFRKQALKDVSLTIHDGEFLGIIGHTGSGKSTLIQHFNGLLRPSSGKILYNNQDIYAKGFSMRTLRQKVGLVFQYPEYQLFETDVLKDICFGPTNCGMSREEACISARKAMQLTGLDASYETKSPFELSGGEKRRVAIAGVLAMQPEVMILDEPTAGLDPSGHTEILDMIYHLHQKTGMTIIMVSHSMEDIGKYADRLVVVNNGEIWMDDTPARVFARGSELRQMGLDVPQVTALMHLLTLGGIQVDESTITVDKAAEILLAMWRKL